MADDESFPALLQRAREGDAAALTAIACTYEKDLRIAARVHLGFALRPYLDSLDLVQSVHRSLMMGLRSQKFDISSPEKLIALALTYLLRFDAAWRFQQSCWGAILHPLGVLVLLMIQWYATFRHWIGRPIGWKGRSHPDMMDTPSPNV